MKNKKIYLYYVLGFLMLLTLLVGCASESNDEPGRADSNPSVTENGNGYEPSYTENGAEFSHSNGINEDGFWEGVVALDYVEIFNFDSMEIPSDVHHVSDEEVELEIENLLVQFPPRVMDRAVVDGDTVNIDFVGSVDGVEFENGSAEGADVTIGVTNFIDDFLEQLIGHMPGDIVNVEVTFPDDYHEESLSGEDALFVTTINFIAGEGPSELTDEFVLESLYDIHGWTNVSDLEEGVHNELQRMAISAFIDDYILSEVNVSSIPEQLIRYQEQAILFSIERSAAQFGMSMEQYLEMGGYSSVDEIIEENQEGNLEMARRNLVVQAVAEYGGFSISREEVGDFFEENFGTRDYSSYEEELGLPYIVQVILNQRVFEHIVDNAVLL